MNEVLQNLKTRRSVRRYLDKAVPKELAEQIVEAGLYAPSGRNTQNWQFTVVQGREKVEKLRSAVAVALGDTEYDGMYGVPLFILVTVPKESKLGRSDCACALENMFLAAHSLGLGSVWINQLADTCGVPAVREVLTEFGVPEGHVNYGCAAIGYAAQEAPADRENRGAVVYVS